MDPDGNYVVMDNCFSGLISDMYNKSKTFRYYFNNLLLEKNVFNENLFVYIRIADNTIGTATAIMRTDRETITDNTTFFSIDDSAKLFTTDIPKGSIGQVIIIDIDYEKFQVRNKVSIIAEEVFHAWEARLMGEKKWNDLSQEENEIYEYYDRPREIRAKEAAKIIEGEYE